MSAGQNVWLNKTVSKLQFIKFEILVQGEHNILALI